MIPETIIKELHRQGISRKELHRLTGISWSIISRFLNGKASIETRNLEKICKVLNITLTNINQKL